MVVIAGEIVIGYFVKLFVGAIAREKVLPFYSPNTSGRWLFHVVCIFVRLIGSHGEPVDCRGS